MSNGGWFILIIEGVRKMENESGNSFCMCDVNNCLAEDNGRFEDNFDQEDAPAHDRERCLHSMI